MRPAHYLIAALLVVVTVTASHSNGAPSLAGTKWSPAPLSGFAGSQERPVYLEFETADKVVGFAGCNRFFGSFNQSGDKLKMGPLATTRMACEPQVSDRETRFLELLGKARLVDVADGEMALKTWEGAVLLRLTLQR